jgi:hypothetical protein
MELFIFARFRAQPGNEAALEEAMLEGPAPTRAEPLIDHPFDITRTERIG